MRFSITKNGELPVREQLVRQVVLGILSQDLPAGYKLPSVPALARQHDIHSNVVSAAYHDLVQQGWVELRPGSGAYVRAQESSAERPGLDGLLAVFLQSARSQGYEPGQVFERLAHLVRPRSYQRVLIVEPQEAMREVLRAELAEQLGIPVEAVESVDSQGAFHNTQTLVVALPTRAAKVRGGLPESVLSIPLRVRSAGTSLEGETKPGPEVVIFVASRSFEVRQWARAMLIALGIDPVALCELDTAGQAWQDRIGRGALVVADVVTARELPGGCKPEVYRVIADSSIVELKQLCGE
jgi:DNA-binding transcriptional regulator YhcF (GntR family)